jgi:hypothetical protein
MNQRDPELARARAQARLRRGMFLLPSLFTAGNIGAGYFSITQTIAAIGSNADAHMHLDWAAMAILFAIPFDALDGRIARMTNTTSEFGKELDSLADVITFGVAPSLLAYIWGLSFLPDTMNVQLHQHLVQACVAERHDWRGSISATMRNQAILEGRTRNTLSGCRFRPLRELSPQLYISLARIQLKCGGSRFPGCFLWVCAGF